MEKKIQKLKDILFLNIKKWKKKIQKLKEVKRNKWRKKKIYYK